MKKPVANLFVELVSWFFFSTMIATGLLLEFVLPKKSGKFGLTFLGYPRHNWSDVHALLSVGFLVAVLLHVVLHWHWIALMCWGTTEKPQPWVRRAGALSVLMLSLLVILTPLLFQ